MGEIREYMSFPVLSIDSDATVQEAAKYMHDHEVGALFVTKNEEYVGILCEKDITCNVIGRGLDPETTKISSVMSKPILSMDCHQPIEDAGEFMCKNRIRHLAVTEKDKIVGVLLVKDLFSYCAQTFHMVR